MTIHSEDPFSHFRGTESATGIILVGVCLKYEVHAVNSRGGGRGGAVPITPPLSGRSFSALFERT